jgi:thiosulfate/3-mercaptopyruvate sulfurtransferase
MNTHSYSNTDQLATDDVHTGLLVDPEWIAEHLGDPDVQLVEVDVSRGAYDAGHIPGAALWNAYADLRHRDYAPITSTELAALLSRSGISPASTIVFYGYGTYLGFWLMKRYGDDRVLLMDGSRERWERAGYQLTAEKPTTVAASYELTAEDPSLVASREVVQDLIGRRDGAIVDVRSDAEFAGERFWPSGATDDAGRTGHIPAAMHIPFDLFHDEGGRLKSRQELWALCEASGLGRDRRVVTYCTIGNRASHVWFALRHVLCYPDVSVYYGSWVEWGKLPDTPIQA